MKDMSERTCIVTRQVGEPDGLLRFVAGPDMSVVPDLKRKLPGRGCWVTAERQYVEQAAKKNIFARALKMKVTSPDDLPEMVDRLLKQSVLGSLGLARKAGQVVMGAAKAEGEVDERTLTRYLIYIYRYMHLREEHLLRYIVETNQPHAHKVMRK